MKTDKKILNALYLINKLAKQDRDRITGIYNMRESIKYLLFYDLRPTNEEIRVDKLLSDDTYGECESILKKHDVTQLSFIIDTDLYMYCHNKETAKILYDKAVEGIRLVIEEFILESKEYKEDKIFFSDIDRATTEEDLEGMIQDEVLRDDLLCLIEELNNCEKNLEEAKKGFEKLHNILHDATINQRIDELKRHQQVLYSIKDAVLIKAAIPVKEYHHSKYNDDKYALAYYEVEGYGFHRIVEWTDEIKKIVKPIVIDNISGEIKRNIDMTEEEALHILLEYLRTFDVVNDKYTIEDIINGDVELDRIFDDQYYNG